MRLEIIFRKLTKPLPLGWKNRTHWQVEAHSYTDGQGYPVGIAWVLEPLPMPDHTFPPPAVLDFILVPDHYRRRGIARRLINACRERWAELVLTEAISEAGAALTAAVSGKD